MAAKTLTWLSVNPADLSAEEKKAFAGYEAGKTAFEACMEKGALANGMMTADQRLVFSYRRGLAVAIDTKRSEGGKWPGAATVTATTKTKGATK